MSTKRKTYQEAISIPDYRERFLYLKLDGVVSDRTFGGYRYLNQVLYHDSLWRRVRREIILRDSGCDLAHDEHPLGSRILVHHLNPITIEDVMERRPCVFDPDNLICTSHQTHNAIHYGDDVQLDTGPIIRVENDTCPWR